MYREAYLELAERFRRLKEGTTTPPALSFRADENKLSATDFFFILTGSAVYS
jgi:hypothetical protein